MNTTEGRVSTVEQTYAGTTATLNQARSDASDVLRAHGLEALIDDAQLVLSELTSNAVEASPDQPYRVVITVTTEQVSISVSNHSDTSLPAPTAWGPDEVLAKHGRGLLIVNALSQSVDVTVADALVTVTASLPIVPG